jgi:HK97 family phage major capsid protein
MQVFEKRVVTTALPAGGPGSRLIETELMAGQYIDRLRAALVIRRLGARVLSGLIGNVDLPGLSSSAAASWIAENSAISATDPEFRKVSLTPRHVGAITEFSRNMLLQSSPDIEELLRDDFAKILAEKVDLAAIDGAGGIEPTGILVTNGLDTTVSMSTPTWAKVLELIETVQLADSEGSAFLTDPAVVRKLRSTLRAADTDSRMVQESPNELAGYPLASTTLMPLSGSPSAGHHLIFGKWSDLLLGYWSVFDLLVNPYESTAYSKGNVQVRGIVTMDVAVRHIASFAASTDVGV